jgi:hypothetical protein
MADKPNKVTLDAGTAAKLESALRGALVTSSAANIGITMTPPSHPGLSVSLDPALVARFSEHLRHGLVQASAANIQEQQAADAETGKIK